MKAASPRLAPRVLALSLALLTGAPCHSGELETKMSRAEAEEK